MIMYEVKLSEFTAIKFEGDKVDIIDDDGTRVILELIEFENMIDIYNKYMKMLDIKG